MLGFGLLTAETVRSLGSASELCTPTGETHCACELTELLVVRSANQWELRRYKNLLRASVTV